MLLRCWLLTSVAVALLTSTPTAVAGLSLSLRSLVLWVTTALVRTNQQHFYKNILNIQSELFVKGQKQ